MHILYVTTYDAKEPNAWSGTGYNIPEALKQAGCRISYLGPLKQKESLRLKLQKKWHARFSGGKISSWDRHPSVLKNFAAQIESETKRIKPEVIVSPGTIPVTYVDTQVPIITWADAVFGSMVDYYPGWQNLHPQTIKQGNRQEKEALHNTTKTVFSSEWARGAAVELYKMPYSRTEVIPFGANNSSGYTDSQVRELIDQRGRSDAIHLLFVGVEWERKGGPKAVEITRRLADKGYNVTLHVAGVKPEIDREAEGFVQVHGFLNKKDSNHKEQLHRLFSECHFFIMPVNADCTPIVIAEANSYGLPCLVTHTGGLGSLIEQDQNGCLFEPDEAEDVWAEQIAHLINSTSRYANLSASSYQTYSNKLNWETASRQFKQIALKVTGKSQ